MPKKWFDGIGNSIIIRRTDVKRVHDYAQTHCSLRDYLLIRLPMKIGLRTSEIRTLRIENVNFAEGSFQVLDSKKHKLYPLPLDLLTLQLIKDVAENHEHGYVFKHDSWQRKRKEKALGRVAVYTRISRIGSKAGVKKFNPRILRHYFAADWHYIQEKSVEGLRRILRHKTLSVTHLYLSRLYFFEDLKREYAQLKNPYFETEKSEQRKTLLLNQIYKTLCVNCLHEKTCRFIDQVSASEWATGCKFYTPKTTVKTDLQYMTS